MKPEIINRLIAEHCGWTISEGIGDWISPHDGCAYSDNAIPNYCTDLNAMHEAEATLHGIAKEEYCCFLISESIENSGRWDCAHATAAQRAEAFLLTVGKWEDG